MIYGPLRLCCFTNFRVLTVCLEPSIVMLTIVLSLIQVMANADTPEDALKARKNGAEGIGLCRTEHMVYILLSALACPSCCY